METVKQIGVENYLAEQIKKDANVAPNRRGDGEGMKAKEGVLDIF